MRRLADAILVGKAAGFAGYLTKPIDMVRLLGLVDELLAAGRN
ncbi:MAG: hypothetical protein Q8M01_03980 [Rubrivivax sp.]|nr:hypothetical protein [Rubrivivax sp.]